MNLALFEKEKAAAAAEADYQRRMAEEFARRRAAVNNAIANGASPDAARAVALNNDPLAGLNWGYAPDGGGYGDRSMYDLPAGATKWHSGLDLYGSGQRIGTPLYSPWQGTIVRVEKNSWVGRGNYVVIQLDSAIFGKNIYVLMQHMDRVDVALNTRIEPGDLVGAVGNSGVGPPKGHLHIEIMVGGITSDAAAEEPSSDPENYYSIDPVNDPRAQAILRTYSPAY